MRVRFPLAWNMTTVTTSTVKQKSPRRAPQILSKRLERNSSFVIQKHDLSWHNQQTKYSLKFASIISPGALTNVRVLQEAINSRHKVNKLIVKQSYMLLAWVLYVQDSTRKDLSKEQKKQIRKPGFFVYPKRQYKFTHTKAPMAHKTFSQEQYMFRFYYMSVTFKVRQKLVPNSTNKTLLFALKQRRLFTAYGTNLFFMRRSAIVFSATDPDLLCFSSLLKTRRL